MLSQRIETLMTLLHCNNTEVARYAGCSSGHISKLKTGRRTPDPESPMIRRFVNGIYHFAEEEGQLDALQALCAAEDTSEDAVLPKLTAWLYEDGEAVLPVAPAPASEQRKAYRRKRFADRLDRVMTLLELPNIQLAARLSVDVSLISRYRGNYAFPRENPLLAAAMSDFLYTCAERSGKTAALAELCSLHTSEFGPEALAEWLFDLPGDNPSTFAKALLRSLENFTPGQGVPAVAPEPPEVESAPYYNGTDGLRSAVVRFLTDAAHDGGELLLYSDEPMDWMAADRNYFALWASLMVKCVKSGVHIKIIHNLDRAGKEMAEAISGWFPLYISGMIEPYVFRVARNNRFCHTFFLHRGRACIKSFFPLGSGNGRRYDYVTDKAYLDELESEFDTMLSGAVPFLKTYPTAMSEDYRRFRIDAQGSRHYPLSELPVFSMPEQLLARMLSRTGISETQRAEALAYYHDARKQFSDTLRDGAVDLLLYPADEDTPRTPHVNFSLDLLELSVDYTPEEYAEHIAAICALAEQEENLCLTLLPSAPFRDLQIVAMGDSVTVLRCREPYAAFVFTNPMLTQSVSDYFSSLIELHGAERDAVLRALKEKAGRFRPAQSQDSRADKILSC